MSKAKHPKDDGRSQNAEIEMLRERLAEAEETLEAIRTGAVDAFIVGGDDGDKVQTLRGAERPYQVLVETMLQGALILSDDGMVLFANRRVSELLGIPHERLNAQQLSEWVAPRHQKVFRTLLARGLQQDARADLVLLRADGTEVVVHLTASRLPLESTAALTVTITDMTRELEHAELERRHDDSRRSEQRLIAADRQKDEFLATLANELRNPLGPVRNLVEVLRRKGAATPDVEWAQNVIDRQIQRMSGLVDELLDLSGIAQDRIDLERHPVELAEIIDAAHERCAPVFEEWGHEIILELPDEPVLLYGDRNRLVQVFCNLFTNAANSLNRFGRIELSADVDDDVVTVRVRDNGAGIAAQDLPRIFEMFARIDRSVKGEQTSLGIGLALAERLVTLHGGRIEAHSEGPGKGSEFVVRLPVYVAPPQRATPSQAWPPSGLRVLIVDDHADSADALGTMLRMYGNEVRTAYSGTDALESGAEFEPQVVVLDLGMPLMDGYETCRRIRATDWGETAHILAITGRGQADDRRRTLESGFDHHLVKPVDPTMLTQLLAGLTPRDRLLGGRTSG